MGGPKQKGITQYCECTLYHDALVLWAWARLTYEISLLPSAAISATEQQPMKGALKGYIFNGYRRVMKFAPKFIVPLVFGE